MMSLSTMISPAGGGIKLTDTSVVTISCARALKHSSEFRHFYSFYTYSRNVGRASSNVAITDPIHILNVGCSHSAHWVL
jgi:hypothetical protein